MMDVKVSEDKHITRWYDRDEIFDKKASKAVHKDEESDGRGKKLRY